jgi:hypothetical protein
VLLQRKLKSKEEGNMEKGLSFRPAWVLDHNLAKLWSEGMKESMIPEDLQLTTAEAVKILRLQAWAEERVEELELEQRQPPPPPPQPQPSPPMPTVAATAFMSPMPVAPVAAARADAPVGFVFDGAALARAAALKAGPRVGISPATVLEM